MAKVAAKAKAATRVVFVARIEVAWTARLVLERIRNGGCCIELVEENEQEAGPPLATKPEVDIRGRERPIWRGGGLESIVEKKLSSTTSFSFLFALT